MFIKTVKAKNYEYIQLVESYREDGTTKHRVLYNFGRRDLIKDNAMFHNVVRRLNEIAGMATPLEQANKLPECSDAVPFNYGHLAYAKLWKSIGVENSFDAIQRNSKLSFSLADITLFLAIQHLLSPRSKLGAHQHQEDYYGYSDIPIQHLYRALDKLADSKNTLEDALFYENFVRSGQQLDVVFYDVTTFYFESTVADGLRDFGYSKDNKVGEVQVVMGLLIDSRGMPVGYELYPGNTYEGDTIIAAVTKLKERFGLRRVILVADKGLNSKKNLLLLSQAGFGYVVASRLKSMKKSIQQKVFDPHGYQQGGTKENVFSFKVLPYDNPVEDENGQKTVLKEQLIITYSAKRAAKDRADRQRLIDKALKLAKKPSQIKASFRRGGRKYLRLVEGAEPKYTVDQDLITRDEQFDGYYAIQTSEQTLSADDVLEAYSTLWKIEASFRLMKSTLEVRPVFHWTPQRIRGHFVVCFLAFLLERSLEKLLSDNEETEAFPDKIREALNSMKLLCLNMNGEEVYLREKHKPLATAIFRLLKIPLPKNLSSKTDIDKGFHFAASKKWSQLTLL